MPKKSSKAGVKYGLRTQEDKHPNQWTGSPKQEKFLLLYLDPKSKTFANSYESAMEAGFSESYSKVIASPAMNRHWLKEARNLVNMGPEHIAQALQDEALNHKDNRGSDRIRALELLAKMQGLFVEKKIVGHVNIEEALNELK
jgi:hypothetical protein